MVRDISNFYCNVTKLLVDNKIITHAQLSYIRLIQVFSDYDNILELLIDENIVDNETLVEFISLDDQFNELKQGMNSIQILDYENIEHYIQNGYFNYVDLSSNNLNDNRNRVAINNIKHLPKLLKLNTLKDIKLIKINDFHQLIEHNFSHLNTIKSKYYLDFISPILTAKNIDYKKAICGLIILFISFLLSLPSIFFFGNHATYLIQNILKIFLFIKSIDKMSISATYDPYIYLPIYTILIPLYKEEEKILSILDFIRSFDYPQHKLDIKIIVEQDDLIFIDKIQQYYIPTNIQILKVPFSLPRTKPKALNYALQYCRGKYVVVYDAEDRPDPTQLLKAVHIFAALPSNYACLQARLNFYNADENLLTKCLSIEYSIWFEYLLEGLSKSNLPLTLGGTSNHFKTEVLRSVGGWDAYNVTEDADLGIRLYVSGYRVQMIDSYTMEEAPIYIIIWLNQRARWIKGFIQTYLVFSKQNYSQLKLSPLQVATIYLFIGVASYSFLCLPWLVALQLKSSNILLSFAIINILVTFSYTYGSVYYVLQKSRGRIKNFKILDYFALLLFPFYFLLHVIASYRAIFENLIHPFRWNKTTHGLSRISHNRNDKT